ncbi:MAG: aldo/keto reductase [Lachnospiraceae bacterium]|nr:aldo/keto reductase [Lachnospiraceae bacterium]
MIATLSNGMTIPKIGLGVWGTSGEEAANAVDLALRGGYRHIDTAAFYKNEEQVAEGIRRSGIKREDIIIATKVWFEDMIDEASVRAALEDSLMKKK